MASNEVHGKGPSDAKIMVVGEAPATEEVRLGEPFVGRAGQEVDRLFASAGIDRSKCYLTNASLEPVRTADKDQHFFTAGKPTEVYLRGIGQLVQDIQRIRPNVVCAFGNYALWALTTLRGVMKWRGSILQSPLTGTKVVATIHPAALLRGRLDPDSEVQGGMWKYRNVVIWDLKRVVEQSAFPEYRLRPRTLEIDPTGTDRERAIQRLLAAEKLTFDIESFGGTELACIGFSDFDPEWAVTFRANDENRILFRQLLETEVPKYGQNLMYDCTMLDMIGIHPRNIVFDTMLAQHTLLVELPKSLAFTTSIYTDIPYYKDEGKEWSRKTLRTEEDFIGFLRYNAKDVCATTEVAQTQMEELTDAKMWPVMQRRMDVFEPLRQATIHGDRCDGDLLHQLIKDTTVQRDLAQERLNALAGYDINPRSPKQIVQFLYHERRLPARTKDGHLTTDARTLNDLAAKTGDPALAMIKELRETSKLLSNYYNVAILSTDGRLRSSYNIAGTVSGRLSSSAPLWGPGLNGQNVPPDARKLYIADEGYELAEFDQSQAEAVVTAYLANDPIHIDCFRTGKDVHRVTACLLLDIPVDQWESIPKKSPQRELCKRANHAFNYGMGADTFMLVNNQYYEPGNPNTIVLDQRTARDFRDKYLRLRPALNSYWDGIRAEIRSSKTLRTPHPLNWTRVFLDQFSDTLLKEAYSWKPQSSVGEITNLALSRLYRDPVMQECGLQILGQVHDSIRVQWPKTQRDTIMKHIWPLLETELYINGYRVIIPWEGVVGHNWYKPEMEPLGVSRKTCEVIDA